MAGQGTLGLELCEQVEDVTQVVVPVGGGGLISGVATAVKALAPQARVIGVEPAVISTLGASIAAGEPLLRPRRHDGRRRARPADASAARRSRCSRAARRGGHRQRGADRGGLPLPLRARQARRRAGGRRRPSRRCSPASSSRSRARCSCSRAATSTAGSPPRCSPARPPSRRARRRARRPSRSRPGAAPGAPVSCVRAISCCISAVARPTASPSGMPLSRRPVSKPVKTSPAPPQNCAMCGARASHAPSSSSPTTCCVGRPSCSSTSPLTTTSRAPAACSSPRGAIGLGDARDRPVDEPLELEAVRHEQVGARHRLLAERAHELGRHVQLALVAEHGIAHVPGVGPLLAHHRERLEHEAPGLGAAEVAAQHRLAAVEPPERLEPREQLAQRRDGRPPPAHAGIARRGSSRRPSAAPRRRSRAAAAAAWRPSSRHARRRRTTGST